eukprot:1563049-Rhodomonas_salina.2
MRDAQEEHSSVVGKGERERVGWGGEGEARTSEKGEERSERTSGRHQQAAFKTTQWISVSCCDCEACAAFACAMRYAMPVTDTAHGSGRNPKKWMKQSPWAHRCFGPAQP